MPATVTTTHTTAAMTTTSAAIIAAGRRKHLVIQNNGPNTIWIKVGAAAVVNEGYRLEPTGTFVMSPQEGNLDVLAVNGITAVGTATALVGESV